MDVWPDWEEERVEGVEVAPLRIGVGTMCDGYSKYGFVCTSFEGHVGPHVAHNADGSPKYAWYPVVPDDVERNRQVAAQ